MLGATDATVTRFRDGGADVDLESGPTGGSARMARSIPERRREPALTQSVAAVVWFEPVSNHFRFNGALWRNRMVLQELPPVGSPPYLADIMVFKGILVPLAMVEEVGLPRAQYVIMNEEYEYCLRALGRGRRHYILPVPLLLPLEEEAPRGYPAWRGYYQARNRLAMILEHRSVAEFAWWALAQVKYIVAAVVGRDQAWERIRLRLLGAWHALRGMTGITLDQADGGKRLPAPFDVESATVTRNGGCAGA
jgi:GT2 family glycosyltransferase